jgi:hypothetical protein
MSLKVGDRFTVSAPHEVRSAKGRLLARYRPEFDYRVTERNVGDANKMLAEGIALAGGNAAAREVQRMEKTAAAGPRGKSKSAARLRGGSAAGKIRATVNTGPKGDN